MSTSPETASKPKAANYNGGCHCGRVKFTMKLSPPIEDGTVTNCNFFYEDVNQSWTGSICAINGLLMVYPLDKNIEWLSGYDDMTSYVFGKERIKHSFCSICGTNVRAKSNHPDFFPDNSAINVRTIEGLNLDTLNLRKFDGKSL